MFFLHGTLTDDDPNWQQFNGFFFSGKSSPEITGLSNEIPHEKKQEAIPRVNDDRIFEDDFMGLNSWAPPKVGSGVSEVWV